MDSKVLKTLVGFGVILLFCLFTKSIAFFTVSIICTLGIALIVWIPLAYLIGSVVFYLLRLFGVVKAKSVFQAKEGYISKEQIAIEDYIKGARSSCLSDEQITSALKEKGWQDDEIKKAFSKYQQQ